MGQSVFGLSLFLNSTNEKKTFSGCVTSHLIRYAIRSSYFRSVSQEVVVHFCLSKYVFLNISQISQENNNA